MITTSVNESVREQFETLKTLEAGWYGPYSNKPDGYAVDFVGKLVPCLESLDVHVSIEASPSGSVSLDFSTPDQLSVCFGGGTMVFVNELMTTTEVVLADEHPLDADLFQRLISESLSK